MSLQENGHVIQEKWKAKHDSLMKEKKELQSEMFDMKQVIESLQQNVKELNDRTIPEQKEEEENDGFNVEDVDTSLFIVNENEDDEIKFEEGGDSNELAISLITRKKRSHSKKINARKSKLSKNSFRSSFFGGFSSGDDFGLEVCNTETLHMHCVALHNNPKNFKKALVTSIGTLLVTFLQIFVLSSLTYEISHPTCSAHTDCLRGLFCGRKGDIAKTKVGTEFLHARCEDCKLFNVTIFEENCMNKYDVNKYNLTKKAFGFGSIDPHILWYGDNDHYYFDPRSDNQFYADFSKNELTKCLAQAHCQSTTLAQEDSLENPVCPHLSLTMKRLSLDQIIVFIAIIFLFASSLTSDIEESSVEEAVLDYVIKTHGRKNLVSRYILRTSIRIRRHILPWFVAGAASSVILVDGLSSKNILLNLLAVIFITETDNTLAKLFLSPDKLNLADNVVEAAKSSKIARVSFWGTRMLSVFVSVVMFIVTIKIEKLMNLVLPHNIAKCNWIYNFMLIVFQSLLPFITSVHILTIVHLVYDKESGSRKMLKGILHLSRNLVAYYASMLFTGIADFTVKYGGKSDLFKQLINISLALLMFLLGQRVRHSVRSDIRFFSLRYIFTDIFLCLSCIFALVWPFIQLMRIEFLRV